MFKKIALTLGVLIVVLLAYAATRPDSFHFERAITIRASAEKIEPLLVNFRDWQQWSPWENLDPQMKRTYRGPASGPGAIYEWTGNGDVGSGRMQILSATPNEVEIKLDFLEPMKVSNTTKFALTPADGGTNVVWSMDGPMPYLSKLMTVFVSMETLLSKDFESGLAALKAAAEQQTS